MRDCDHPLSILRCRRALPIEALDGVLAATANDRFRVRT
jgi:hypothetical protein